MSVLVTGASGFLGHAVSAALRARGRTVVGTSQGQAPAYRALSLEDGGGAASDLVRALRPAAIVHLAALSDADVCAKDPTRAHRINASATAAIAAAAREVGAHLIFASSDLVFGGDRAPYAEGDPTGPLGPYMASKLAAEEAVLAASPGFLVARLALLYGPSAAARPSFTDGLIARLRKGEPASLFVDQVRTPLLVDDAGVLLADLLDRGAGGLLHLAGPERISRHAHGVAIATALGLDPGLCRPTRLADAPISPRPADTSMRIERLVRLVGWTPRGIAAGCLRLAASPPSTSDPKPGINVGREPSSRSDTT